MNKKYIFGGLVVVVLSVVLSMVFGGTKTVQTVREQLGANSGPTLSWPSWTVNGVEVFYGSVAFNTGTDTPCILTSPAATSTLDYASADVTSATSTDLFVDLARAGTGDVENHATTTLLSATQVWSQTTAGVAKDDILPVFTASTTSSGNPGVIFPPNTNFVVKLAAKNVDPLESASDQFNVTGACKARWVVNGN